MTAGSVWGCGRTKCTVSGITEFDATCPMPHLELESPAPKAWKTQEQAAPGRRISEWSIRKVRTADFASDCPFPESYRTAAAITFCGAIQMFPRHFLSSGSQKYTKKPLCIQNNKSNEKAI